MPNLGCWWFPVGLVAFAAVAWLAGQLLRRFEDRLPPTAHRGFPVRQPPRDAGTDGDVDGDGTRPHP